MVWKAIPALAGMTPDCGGNKGSVCGSVSVASEAY